MKACYLIVILTIASLANAAVPAFIKEGDVYAFLLAGRNDSESSLAKVEKIDASGWLEITLIQKGERIWINLAQVQIVIPSKVDARSMRESLIKRKVMENLWKIAAAVDQHRILQNKEPSSVAEAFGFSSGYIPLEIQDGEDYTTVDISGDKPLTIKTKSGYEISYKRKGP